MRKIIVLLLLMPYFLFSQGREMMKSPFEVLSEYKYIVLSDVEGSFLSDARRRVAKTLDRESKKFKYTVVNLKYGYKTHDEIPLELSDKPELGVYINVITQKTRLFGDCYKPVIELYDYKGNFLSQSVGPNPCGSFGSILNKTALQLINPGYFPRDSNKKNTTKSFFEDKFDINSEKSIRDYLDLRKGDLEDYEGIYRYTSSNPSNTSQYKFLILKEDYVYYGFIMEANCVGCQNWTRGDSKFEMTEGAVPNLFDVSWGFPEKEKRRDLKIIFTGDFEGGVLKNNEISLLKLYPKLNSSSSNNRPLTGEWTGTGSGIIISESGYIVTNNHVIEKVNEIEVEFILNGEVQKFNAEIVKVDKVNDLAILKIFDMKFDGVDDIPYNFNSRSSDVGTKVYAYGYPMALSAMGKEIKITDGIISAKSGFDGDITTYQITAAIQKGNSGGPLFDDKGNFIGINSSGIRKDVADNVGYSIKSNYVLNLLDVLPKSIDLPSNNKLESLPLTEQIKEISKYVVLIKVK